MRTVPTLGLLALLALAGCSAPGAGGLTEEERAQIPQGANVVVLYSDMSQDDLYTAVRGTITSDTEMSEMDAQPPMYLVTTSPQSLPRNAQMGLQFRVLPEGDGSKVQIQGLYAEPQAGTPSNPYTDGQPLAWSVDGRQDYAFSNMMRFVKKIPHTRIEYVAQ